MGWKWEDKVIKSAQEIAEDLKDHGNGVVWGEGASASWQTINGTVMLCIYIPKTEVNKK